MVIADLEMKRARFEDGVDEMVWRVGIVGECAEFRDAFWEFVGGRRGVDDFVFWGCDNDVVVICSESADDVVVFGAGGQDGLDLDDEFRRQLCVFVISDEGDGLVVVCDHTFPGCAGLSSRTEHVLCFTACGYSAFEHAGHDGFLVESLEDEAFFL